MFLLVLAYLGCAGQNPESHKMVVVAVVINAEKNTVPLSLRTPPFLSILHSVVGSCQTNVEWCQI